MNSDAARSLQRSGTGRIADEKSSPPRAAVRAKQVSGAPVKRRGALNHERRVLVMALAAGLPAIVVALVLLWTGDYSPKVCWTLTVLLLGCWLGFSLALQARVMHPLQTISNLLAALGEGDYSIRARGG